MDWHLLLEYLKVLLSWPPVVACLVLVLAARFRAPIEDLVRRLVEGKILGQEFKAVPSQQRDAVTLKESSLPLPAPAGGPASASVPTSSNTLPPELTSDPPAVAALEYVRAHPVQTVLDIRRLTFAYNADRLFHQLYGTQIALLDHLVATPDSSATLASLAKFHEEHQRLAGSTEYQVRPYVEFLVNSGILNGTGPDDGRQYTIAQRGVEFLSYIKATYPGTWNRRPF